MSYEWFTQTERVDSHSPPGEILSSQVPVVADEAVRNEILLRRSQGVTLQHLQAIQHLHTHNVTISYT